MVSKQIRFFRGIFTSFNAKIELVYQKIAFFGITSWINFGPIIFTIQ